MTLQFAKKKLEITSSPPAEFVVPRRLTAVVRVWAEVSLSVVTCKCMRPDPVTVVAAAAAKLALAGPY